MYRVTILLGATFLHLTSSKRSPSVSSPVLVWSPDEQQRLDIYTYHRGRVSDEPRDPVTGELLCDTDPVDTNHYWAPPKSLVCRVVVKFPLGGDEYDDYEDSDLDDDEVDGKGQGSGGGEDASKGAGGRAGFGQPAAGEGTGGGGFGQSSVRASRSRAVRGDSSSSFGGGNQQSQQQSTAPKQSAPYFEETVHWDLSSPNTPTPEEYAANIATEFGLSFVQTMDLTESIIRQINRFCRNPTACPPFFAPIAVVDPYGSERLDCHFGPPEAHCGPVWNAPGASGPGAPGGGGSIVRRSGSNVSGASSRGSSSSRPAGAIKPDRRGIHIVPKSEIPAPNPSGDVHAAEVLRRAMAKSTSIVREALSRKEATMGIVRNEVCHICHNRKENGLTFHCGRHAYCDYHCAVSC